MRQRNYTDDDESFDADPVEPDEVTPDVATENDRVQSAAGGKHRQALY